MGQIKTILNVSTLLDIGAKATPVSDEVDKLLKKHRIKRIPFQCNPLEAKWMSDLQKPMEALLTEFSNVNAGKYHTISTDFFTPLMHIIGVHFRHDGPVDTKFDNDTPFLVRVSTINYEQRQHNIKMAARLLADFFAHYRLPLFMWRRSKNLMVWPNMWTAIQLPYSTICAASRAACGDSKFAPIFHAQNFIVANFMDIYAYMKENYLAIAIPDERIPLSNRCAFDSTWMSMEADQILWRCMCQIIGAYCPSHNLVVEGEYEDCSPVEDPVDIGADLMIDEILERNYFV